MQHNYLLGIFDDDDTLLHAVSRIRKEGFDIREVYTPFPVHGLDDAMGLQDTRLHTMGFVFGAIGTLTAFTMMTYVGLDWKTIVGGKPYFNFYAMGPVMFEMTVLFCAVGMTIVYYIRNGFSVFRDPEITYPRSSDDKFVMAFCLKQYSSEADQQRLSQILTEEHVEKIEYRSLDTEIAANAFKVEEHADDHAHHAAHH
ncbi:MAG: DUF3341 domain-containing protein [Chitinophagales bacterium]|jgi:hypothetical protein|nr:DUF3341 domain-containing protein [Chitinophagales bacterium]